VVLGAHDVNDRACGEFARLAMPTGRQLGKKRGADHVDDTVKDQLARICREVLAPLVKNDGGEMSIVRFEGDDVHIHLSGACAGCPGASLTGDKVILPVLRIALPKVRVVISTGVKIPEGAQKL
jgi:Fe-S cluster biogenesis protein NfuA